MPSSSPTGARAGRAWAISLRTRSMPASMRVLTSVNMPFRSLKSISVIRSSCGPRAGALYGDRRADRLAEHDAADVARLPQVEHDDREFGVHAQRDRRGVHAFQMSFEDLQMRNRRVFRRLRVDHRIVRVDAVDLGALQDHVG